MEKYLQHMRIKIAAEADQIVQAVSESQNKRYPIMRKLIHVLDPGRTKMVLMFADTLIMEESERVEVLKEWGKNTGTKLANYDIISLDMMLREMPKYRNTLGAVLRHEAIELNLSASEMYNLITVLDQLLNDALYFFSMPFVQHEQERLKLSQILISELSVPIVSINDQTAILPLVGTVDHDRSLILHERVLHNASEMHLENLIIDLSGLQTTDTFVAQQLFYLFDGLSLLGIQPIVSGISPAIAQTLVQLGLSFGRIKSFATLKQALAYIEK
ncbi:STAS domain-containing protein [Sporosarcina sp. ANT_H38]|uniref:STAS domain-containing protein n=1 Tax=Sporosarcina sp. ANT_H38 TaxID=2597358 RepID=UPI0011F331A7|nr:STAS domain-containing protein [Sporosarcina sp. ANT_H38]KAA0944201.1 STAS domain-containing protein [Sporosarcina sp. ANT_H38]